MVSDKCFTFKICYGQPKLSTVRKRIDLLGFENTSLGIERLNISKSTEQKDIFYIAIAIATASTQQAKQGLLISTLALQKGTHRDTDRNGTESFQKV